MLFPLLEHGGSHQVYPISLNLMLIPTRKYGKSVFKCRLLKLKIIIPGKVIFVSLKRLAVADDKGTSDFLICNSFYYIRFIYF